MKMQIYYIDCYMINIKLFAALKLRAEKVSRISDSVERKRAACRLLFFLKDGIEKIITKDKQHLSFDYILS